MAQTDHETALLAALSGGAKLERENAALRERVAELEMERGCDWRAEWKNGIDQARLTRSPRDILADDIEAELRAGVSTWSPGHWIGGMVERIMLDVDIQIESALSAESAALDEVARLRDWINDLQAGCWINCVYCGHRYGPDDEVPASMADVLKEHIEQCPDHPMSRLRAEVALLRRLLGWCATLIGYLDPDILVYRDGSAMRCGDLARRINKALGK